MTFETVFKTIDKDSLSDLVAGLAEAHHRFVQILAVNTEEGIDLVYSFMEGETLTNYEIKAVQSDDAIPSITEFFLEAFVFENEIHDLFGVQIDDIEIDFGGNFYRLAIDEPMTIISPERKAQRDKARKAAQAKAAKEKAAAKADGDADAKASAGPDEAELERKLAAMDPEKAAKVRAAMEAKAAKAKAQTAKADAADAKKAKSGPDPEELERKLAAMDPGKAAKVRAAMEAKAKRDAEKAGGQS